MLEDVIPQSGACPLNCQECFYNAPGFYRPKKSKLPNAEKMNKKGKVIRVNSGHDSNLQRELVIEATKDYKYKFYNTSVPKADFPGPVVLTCNGKDTDRTFHAMENVSNLMYVRVRVDTWNLETVVDKAVKHYTEKGVPVVLTFMRYCDKANVKKEEDYFFKKSILNSYFTIKPEAWTKIMMRYKGNPLVFSCGSPASSFCKDCRNCESFYYIKSKQQMLENLK